MRKKREPWRPHADPERIWQNDLPVRELHENIAELATDPKYERLTREQMVALAYASATARVLYEQSELYMELLVYFFKAGESFAELREQALDQARVVAELFLSARREDADIVGHEFPGQDPSGGLAVLDLIESCDVALAGEDPDSTHLMLFDEVDAWLQVPPMRDWLARMLPREDPLPYFGDQRGRRAWRKALEAGISRPRRAGLVEADGAVTAIAKCLEASVPSYRSLLADRAGAGDAAALRAEALARALQINDVVHDTGRRFTFEVLDPALEPVAAVAALETIRRSCVVLAAPSGDPDRYGLTGDEVDEMLADAALQDWQGAVAAR